jgi:prephenate dehydrogenase
MARPDALPSDALPFSPVLITGTGLLGTSIGLAISEAGGEVWLSDQSPSALALAVDYGAGVAFEDNFGDPELCVVAVPPDVTAQVVRECLERFPNALVIDVASAKSEIVASVGESDRFVGTHPMAGRERGGAMAARVDLFTGRPWVITPTPTTPASVVARVTSLVRFLKATVYQMTPAEHDSAVAAVSHLPQVVSSAMAARLMGVPAGALELAGQGVRDVTRVAASDVGLWLQILGQNADGVVPLLRDLIDDLTRLQSALADVSGPGARKDIADVLARGVEGVSQLPGKHGSSARFASLVVIIDDRPGQLAQLLLDVGSLEVNLEDMTLEHSPGAPVGFVELSVLPGVVHQLSLDLAKRGWRIAGERT